MPWRRDEANGISSARRGLFEVWMFSCGCLFFFFFSLNWKETKCSLAIFQLFSFARPSFLTQASQVGRWRVKACQLGTVWKDVFFYGEERFNWSEEFTVWGSWVENKCISIFSSFSPTLIYLYTFRRWPLHRQMELHSVRWSSPPRRRGSLALRVQLRKESKLPIQVENLLNINSKRWTVK